MIQHCQALCQRLEYNCSPCEECNTCVLLMVRKRHHTAMEYVCNMTRRLGDAQRVILRQRVRGSVRAVRAVRNTLVFLTEIRVLAEDLGWCTPWQSGSLRIWAHLLCSAGRSKPQKPSSDFPFSCRLYFWPQQSEFPPWLVLVPESLR